MKDLVNKCGSGNGPTHANETERAEPTMQETQMKDKTLDIGDANGPVIANQEERTVHIDSKINKSCTQTRVLDELALVLDESALIEGEWFLPVKNICGSELPKGQVSRSAVVFDFIENWPLVEPYLSHPKLNRILELHGRKTWLKALGRELFPALTWKVVKGKFHSFAYGHNHGGDAVFFEGLLFEQALDQHRRYVLGSSPPADPWAESNDLIGEDDLAVFSPCKVGGVEWYVCLSQLCSDEIWRHGRARRGPTYVCDFRGHWASVEPHLNDPKLERIRSRNGEKCWLKALGERMFPEFMWRIAEGEYHSFVYGVDREGAALIFDYWMFKEGKVNAGDDLHGCGSQVLRPSIFDCTATQAKSDSKDRFPLDPESPESVRAFIRTETENAQPLRTSLPLHFKVPFAEVPNLNDAFAFDLKVFKQEGCRSFFRQMVPADVPPPIYEQIRRTHREALMLVRRLGVGHVRYTAVTLRRPLPDYAAETWNPEEAIQCIWTTVERFKTLA